MSASNPICCLNEDLQCFRSCWAHEGLWKPLAWALQGSIRAPFLPKHLQGADPPGQGGPGWSLSSADLALGALVSLSV